MKHGKNQIMREYAAGNFQNVFGSPPPISEIGRVESEPRGESLLSFWQEADCMRKGEPHLSFCMTPGFFFFNGVYLLPVLPATCDSVRNGKKNAEVLFYMSFKPYQRFII